MIQFIKDMLHEFRTKDKCFAQCNINNPCYYKHCGDKHTDYLSHYLSYSCACCPHLVLIFKEELQR